MNNKKSHLTGWIIAAIVFNILVIASTVVLFIYKGHFNFTSDIAFDKLESFGSFVGGICGSLTSLIAIYLVLKTYNSQKEELEATREIAKEQSQTLKIQQFENTYFNMLKMLQEIVNSMSWVDPSKKPHGKREYLNYIYGSLKIEYNYKYEYNNMTQSFSKGSLRERAKKVKSFVCDIYDDRVYNLHNANLSHYFRYIHNIIKYVEQYFKKEDEYIKSYLDLLQAQLSNDELALILYNCLSRYSLNKEDIPQFKNNIDKYGILENLDKEWILFDKELLKIFFPNTKFSL